MRYFMWMLVAAATVFATPAWSQDEDFDEFAEFEGEMSEGGDTATINDPIRGFNVVMYHFNDKVYFWVLQPTAKAWGEVAPPPARRGIFNFFHNVRMPIRLANSALQTKWGNAGNELRRFGVNTTIGFLGFEDAASKIYGWEKKDEDLGQTFGHYGVGPGFYIVWPLLGPSSARDTVGMVGDSFVDPVTYVGGHMLVRPAIRAGEVINMVSLDPDAYPELKKQAVEPYTFIRDIYHQNREKKVAE